MNETERNPQLPPCKQKQARNRRQSTQHRATGCAKLSLGLNFPESPSNSAAIKTKKNSPIEAKERKLWSFEEGQSISSLESRQAWTRPEPQSLDFAVSKCWFQWECPTSAFFCHSLCGPIWMVFGGPETQHGELFSHRRTFFCLAEKSFRIHNRNFFLWIRIFFFCQKNVIRYKKSSPCWVLGPSKIT